MSNCRKIDEWDFRLKISNNSDKVIYFYNSDIYPDTSINFEANPIKSPEFFRVNPSATESNRIRGTWEEKFEEIDTLIIFIFNEDTLNSVPWDTIKANYLILKRYELSYDDIVRMNWTIAYP